MAEPRVAPGPYGDRILDDLRRRSSRLASLLRGLESDTGENGARVRRWASRTESVLAKSGLDKAGREAALRDVLTGGLYEWAIRCVTRERGVEALLDRLGSLACLLEHASLPPLEVEQVSELVERWSDRTSLHPLTSRALARLGQDVTAPERDGERSRPSDARRRPREAIDRDRTDSTRSLIRSVDGLLYALARPAIAWDRRAVSAKWIELVKRVRDVDREQRVSIYSYYSTPSEVTSTMLDRVNLEGPVWEPCSGDGAIARVLEARGHVVHASDIRDDEGVYGGRGVDVFDVQHAVNVVTNPPVRDGVLIAEHLVHIATGVVALLLRNDQDSVMLRRPFFRSHAPRRKLMLSRRPRFLRGGDPERPHNGIWEFSWFVWEPGHCERTIVESI